MPTQQTKVSYDYDPSDIEELILEKHKEEIARITKETGKPPKISVAFKVIEENEPQDWFAARALLLVFKGSTITIESVSNDK